VKLRPTDTTSRELGWALLGIAAVSAAFAVYTVAVVRTVPLAAAVICAVTFPLAAHYLRTTRR
jgi:hypothetical protein